MKRLISLFLTVILAISYICPPAVAIQEVKKTKSVAQTKNVKPVTQAKKTNANLPKIEIAFVFDSNAEKTDQIVKQYRPIITKSLASDYKAVFADDLVFKGNWTEASSIAAAKRALQSRAKMIVCFGFWSGEYLKKTNKTKNVITIDQYAIRGFSNKFFNPVQQSVNDFVVFQRLVPNIGKTAILMNERIYNSKKNWNEIAAQGFKEKGCNVDFVIIPVGNNVVQSIEKIPSDVKSVYITQVYNLTSAQRKQMYDYFATKKIPTFSSMGKEDVELGAMFGTSAYDADAKLAELVSFNIKNVLKGGKVKNTPVTFVDSNILYFNKDTAELIGYIPHVRLLKSAEVITHKKLPVIDLSTVFTTFEERNLSVQRKKYLISAAKRSLASAYLHYLPTVRIDLGYQTYNHDYAFSYQDVPSHASGVTLGIDQMLYSPDLVTNIIVKHKKLKFDKAEKVLTEQNMGLELAQLYIKFAMLKNAIAVKKEQVNEIRNGVAMAKIRKMTGKCGDEEVLRWAGELQNGERELLLIMADYDNVKIHMNQLLYLDQSKDFDLAPIKATDKAFFLSDINLLDHIRTPDKMEKFTKMTIDEAIYVSPETTKLKAAIAMKKAEMGNYAQKFVLPNAKLTWEATHNFGVDLPYQDYLSTSLGTLRRNYGDGRTDAMDRNSQRLMIAAQWKPIEGGTKIAEIARCKSELNELKTYLEQINIEIESNIRTIINRAIAKYLCIERSYIALRAEEENYKLVKERYLMGKATIPQVLDALTSLTRTKTEALNAQYEFYNELVWLQRGLASVNWANASDEAKNFIVKLKKELAAEADINVNL